MPIVPAFWKHDWTYSDLKIGLHYGPWYGPNVMLPQSLKRARGQKPSKPKPESVKLPRWLDRARKVERLQRHETPRQSLSPETLSKRSRVSTWLILTSGHIYSPSLTRIHS